MAKVKAKKHYRYIKRGEVIPRGAEISFLASPWEPFYPPGWFLKGDVTRNVIFDENSIRVEVKPRKA